MKKFKYIYGPVQSWRLGRSLGIDPVTGKGKSCNFNCAYCQVGKTRRFSTKRRIFVPTDKIIDEIKSLPAEVKIDYITFSGAGEPTLARNLGHIIRELKKTKSGKIAILTNFSLIYKKDVQKDLMLADFVMVKLDAHSQKLFKRINKPAKGITYNKILKGIKQFRKIYKGVLGLQIMFVKENKEYAKQISDIAKAINPDEIQLNTPTRPCPVKPLPKKDMEKIKKFFKGTNYTSVYDKGKRFKNLKRIAKRH